MDSKQKQFVLLMTNTSPKFQEELVKSLINSLSKQTKDKKLAVEAQVVIQSPTKSHQEAMLFLSMVAPMDISMLSVLSLLQSHHQDSTLVSVEPTKLKSKV
jgi:hypothetical protein